MRGDAAWGRGAFTFSDVKSGAGRALTGNRCGSGGSLATAARTDETRRAASIDCSGSNWNAPGDRGIARSQRNSRVSAQQSNPRRFMGR